MTSEVTQSALGSRTMLIDIIMEKSLTYLLIPSRCLEYAVKAHYTIVNSK